jgi:hypothetical protein
VTAAADEALRDAPTDSVTFAFGDLGSELYGIARLGIGRAAGGAREGSALAILFAGRAPVAVLARGGLPVADGAGWDGIELGGVRATVEEPLARWRLDVDDGNGNGLALEFAALGAPAELAAGAAAARLGGMAGYDQPCRVRGTVRTGGREHRLAGLGQRGHAWGAADWDRIELARTVTAWTDEGCATLTAIRPAGAGDHAAEATWSALWESADGDGARVPRELLAVDDGRLSTTYDAEGHARRAGLELWTNAADWPRRATGQVLCGSSLDLGALRLDCAFFRWQLEGSAGVGRYDIVRAAA